MNKQNRKISLLDYLITVFVFIFFSIVYSYAYIIWPREEKFKDVDRARMERIDAAEQFGKTISFRIKELNDESLRIIKEFSDNQ